MCSKQSNQSASNIIPNSLCSQVGVKGANAVVLGVEKKSALQLQDPRTVRKVALLDDHICIAFAGTLSSLAREVSPN
jgi:20S proteasome subunit alpha 4